MLDGGGEISNLNFQVNNDSINHNNHNTESESEKYAHLFTFSGSNKAGMESVDKERQARIIYEMSKNSAYYKRQLIQDENSNKKVLTMKSKLEKMTIREVSVAQTLCLDRISQFEKKRCFRRICCVLDMDMFYAAVEIRDQPHLKDKPVAVGGMSMISTTNYVARKYGVRSAMPGFIGRKLCPELVFVDHNFDKYTLVSEQVKGVIKEYDPNFKAYSLDEVYFDLTDAAVRMVSSPLLSLISTFSLIRLTFATYLILFYNFISFIICL